MTFAMPEWIHNPQATYVLAAYAVAVLLLIGLAAISYGRYRHLCREWKNLPARKDGA